MAEPSLERVVALIDELAPLRAQAAWDNSGVQVAVPPRRLAAPCARLALVLDPLPDQVDQALAWGADCVLCHHPLAMAPRLLNTWDDYTRTVAACLKAEALCYAAHTSLDAVPTGPAGWLARELQLGDVVVLEPTLITDIVTYGVGQVGALPHSLAWTELLERVHRLVGRDFCTVSGPLPQRVATVAVCPGSGASLARAARDAGAEVLVTGDVKHHAALESPLALIDVGHFSLEEEMMRRWAEDLAGHPELAGTTVRFFPGADPFTLYPRTERPAVPPSDLPGRTP